MAGGEELEVSLQALSPGQRCLQETSHTQTGMGTRMGSPRHPGNCGAMTAPSLILTHILKISQKWKSTKGGTFQYHPRAGLTGPPKGRFVPQENVPDSDLLFPAD